MISRKSWKSDALSAVGRAKAKILLAWLAASVIAVLALFGVPQSASAQSWPSKPIKFIVAYPPGGSSDVIARLFAEVMSKSLGQPITVENRAGAGGTIGANFVVRSPADGYTLLVGAISEISIGAAVNKDIPYDALTDFSEVVQLAKLNHILVVHPDLPVKNVSELASYLKAHPGQVTYSSFGLNTLNHMTGERLKLALGVDVRHVPYQGSSPSITALMSNQVTFTTDSPSSTLALIADGKLKPIGVLGPRRLASAPSIPTLAEAGLPNFYVTSWLGLLAPKGTPKEVVDRLNKEANAAMSSPELKAALGKLSFESAGGTVEEFRKTIVDEVREFKDVWSKVGGTTK